MKPMADEPTMNKCSVAARGEELEIVPPTRVAILVVPAGEFDASTLAKHLAQTRSGDVAVELLSLDDIPTIARPDRSAIDYASTSARIWKYLASCGNAHDVHVACRNRYTGACGPPQCAQCNMPAIVSEEMDEPKAQAAPSPGDALIGVGTRKTHQSLQQQACNPVTVMIASSREALLADLLPRLASAPDIKVLGDPVTNPALLDLRLEERRPKILLLDDSRDRLASARLRMIHRKHPDVRVLILAAGMRVGLVEDILRNRFDGLLLTHCPLDVYVTAIRAVNRGELWLPRKLLAKAVSDLLQAPDEGAPNTEIALRPPDADQSLTCRQSEIVKLLRQGFTNKEIGRRLGIAEDTVKKHLQNVFEKLGVHRRSLVVLNQAPNHLSRSQARDIPL
jgi:DNA-binding NarL/FixJ family response regulator